jgi:hypothetical protein
LGAAFILCSGEHPGSLCDPEFAEKLARTKSRSALTNLCRVESSWISFLMPSRSAPGYPITGNASFALYSPGIALERGAYQGKIRWGGKQQKGVTLSIW